eukprot:13673986-Alexandrium_andersonii.AAC.1
MPLIAGHRSGVKGSQLRSAVHAFRRSRLVGEARTQTSGRVRACEVLAHPNPPPPPPTRRAVHCGARASHVLPRRPEVPRGGRRQRPAGG